MHKNIRSYWVDTEFVVANGVMTGGAIHTLVVETDLETWPESESWDTSELDDVATSALKNAPHVTRIRVVPLNKQKPQYVPGVATGGSSWPKS